MNDFETISIMNPENSLINKELTVQLPTHQDVFWGSQFTFDETLDMEIDLPEGEAHSFKHWETNEKFNIPIPGIDINSTRVSKVVSVPSCSLSVFQRDETLLVETVYPFTAIVTYLKGTTRTITGQLKTTYLEVSD